MILAAPPVVVPKITFEPLLSDSISKALAAYRPGDVIKIIVRYADPFWSQKGWNGTAQWLEPSGLFVGDASPTTTQPLLVGFAGGPLARTWHTCPADERQAYVLSLIADAFGPEAHSPLDYLERDWVDDPWSGGGYNASIADQNATDAEAVLRAGLPPISFACSELAQSFPGYVEGAILSGMSSAQTVASRLRS